MGETIVGKSDFEADADSVIFSDQYVQITRSRIVVRDVVHAIGDVSAVGVEKRQSWRVAAYLIFFFAGGYFREKQIPVGWAICWLISIISFYLENERPTQLTFSTPSGRSIVLESSDRKYLKSLKEQIDGVLRSTPSATRATTQ
jgi:hypothetical protein